MADGRRHEHSGRIQHSPDSDACRHPLSYRAPYDVAYRHSDRTRDDTAHRRLGNRAPYDTTHHAIADRSSYDTAP